MALLKPIELPLSAGFLIRSFLGANLFAFGFALYQTVNGEPLAGFSIFVIIFCCSIWLYFFERRRLNPVFKVYRDRFLIRDALSLPSKKIVIFSSVYELRLNDNSRVCFITADREISFWLSTINKPDRAKLKSYLAAWAEERSVLVR